MSSARVYSAAQEAMAVNRIIRVVFPALLLSLILLGMSLPYSSAEGASQRDGSTTLEKITGTVRLLREEKDIRSWQGLELIPNDEIFTASRSTADVRFPSDEIIRIMQNSWLRINHSGKDASSLWLPKGKVFNVLGRKRDRTKSLSVVTPVAVASVRGTVFSVESIADEETIVMVTEGQVAVSNPAVSAEEVIITEFQKTSVRKDTPPLPPVPMTPADIRSFETVSDIIQARDAAERSGAGALPEYDPREDPGLGRQAPQPPDLDQVSRLSGDFRDSQRDRTAADEGFPEPVLEQPESYADDTPPPDDKDTLRYPPFRRCPPYCPPDDRGVGTSRDWTRWATDVPPDRSDREPDRKPPSPAPPPQGGLSDVTVDSRDITISVWDHGQVDNDIINITVNGRPIPGGENLVLTGSPRAFNLRLEGGNNEIAIFAVNEGTVAPNTASIKISNVRSGKAEQTYSINQGSTASFTASVR